MRCSLRRRRARDRGGGARRGCSSLPPSSARSPGAPPRTAPCAGSKRWRVPATWSRCRAARQGARGAMDARRARARNPGAGHGGRRRADGRRPAARARTAQRGGSGYSTGTHGLRAAPGYQRCAPDRHFGVSRILCLRRDVDADSADLALTLRPYRTPGVPSVHGLPREGRGTGTGTRAAARRNMTLQDIADRARRRQVVGVALGARRASSRRRSDAPARNVVRTPSTKPSSPRSPRSTRKALARIGTLSDAAFLAAGVALYAGEGSKTDGAGAVREHRPDDGRGSSAPGCGASSRSTSRACACVSTSTKVSISMPLERTGRRSRGPARPVPSAVSRRRRSDASAATSTSSAASTSLLAARRRIVGSWVWSGRCYRRTPFRGSSIGRAFGC